MGRAKISTAAVDAELLACTRAARPGPSYAADPLDIRDNWGDLASFRAAAGAS